MKLASCRVGRFLTGHGPVSVCAPGLGILDLEPLTLEGPGFPAPAPGALECRACVDSAHPTWKEMENLSSQGRFWIPDLDTVVSLDSCGFIKFCFPSGNLFIFKFWNCSWAVVERQAGCEKGVWGETYPPLVSTFSSGGILRVLEEL